ncbi:MAG TPA: hypothetical protein VIM73_10210 [Polyangiaceae bacterium]
MTRALYTPYFGLFTCPQRRLGALDRARSSPLRRKLAIVEMAAKNALSLAHPEQ